MSLQRFIVCWKLGWLEEPEAGMFTDHRDHILFALA
jgi:hypothetical protein